MAMLQPRNYRREEKLKAVVLAAGRGKRLQSLTRDIPKPMLLLGNKPIIQYVIESLRDAGIIDIFINLHYLPEKIKGYFKDGASFGVNIGYSYEEGLLGTAGAIKKLELQLSETFLVAYGDTFRKLNYRKLVEQHRKKGGVATLAVYKTEAIEGCGIIEINEEGIIQKFIEKPAPGETKSNLANAGVCVLETEVLTYIPSQKEFDFGRDLFPLLLSLGRPMFSFIIEEPVLDIGTPESYKQAQRAFE